MEFCVGGFIVSCECLWFGGSNLGVGCECFNGLEAKIRKLRLELLWKSQMKTLLISLKRQFFCEKMELSTGSYILTLHVICLLQVMILVCISIMFPNFENVD